MVTTALNDKHRPQGENLDGAPRGERKHRRPTALFTSIFKSRDWNMEDLRDHVKSGDRWGTWSGERGVEARSHLFSPSDKAETSTYSLQLLRGTGTGERV